MSLAGIIQRSGTAVTIMRATRTQSAGGATNQGWAAVATKVAAFIDTPTAELAQRLYGQETRVEARIFVLPGVPLRPDDGIIVTAGARAGERYRVTGQSSLDFGAPGARSTHAEHPLVRTTETFA
jgi:hypothetical protein